jgi:hypothetical protein
MSRAAWRSAQRTSRPGAHVALRMRGAAAVWRWLPLMVVVLVVAAGLPPSAMAGTGALSISWDSTPTVGLPLSIRVTGAHLPAGYHVRVSLFPDATGCWIEDGGGEKLRTGGELLGGGEVRSKEEDSEYGAEGDPEEGVFSGSYSIVPASSSTPYAVCAELSEGEGAERNPPRWWEASFTATPEPAPGHLTALVVRVGAHAGTTAARPGETELRIQATPHADLHFMLKHHDRTLTKNLTLGAQSDARIVVPWSCSAQGGAYSYTITATDSYGARLARTGKFRGVSATRCRALRAADGRRRSQEARERHEREEQRRREGREAEHENERVRSDQRAYCEQVLGGHVEQVFNGNMIPAAPSEIETECYAHGRNYTLRGDPPVVVRVTP